MRAGCALASLTSPAPSPAPRVAAMNSRFFSSMPPRPIIVVVRLLILCRLQRSVVGDIDLQGQADLFLQAVADIDFLVAENPHGAMGMHHRLALGVADDVAVEGSDF